MEGKGRYHIVQLVLQPYSATTIRIAMMYGIYRGTSPAPHHPHKIDTQLAIVKAQQSPVLLYLVCCFGLVFNSVMVIIELQLNLFLERTVSSCLSK